MNAELVTLYNEIDSNDCYLYNRAMSFEERVNANFIEMHKESLSIRKQLANAERENKARRERFQIAQAAKA